MAKKDEKETKKVVATEGLNTRGSASYGAKDITVLEGLDPVRKRPGMYIGSTGTEGLHHLIWEVVDNSIDEAMAGYAKHIITELHEDGSVSVTDDGRGIPVEIHKQTKKSTLETVMTVLHAGGKFGSDSYKVSGGLHGVGVSVVNALSSWVRVEVFRDDTRYVQEYKQGVPQGPVKKAGSATGTGTKVTFKPDGTIFSSLEWNDKKIAERLRQQAYLTGVRMTFIDRRTENVGLQGFWFEGGIVSFVKHITRGKKHLQDEIFYAHKPWGNMDVEVSFVYTDDIEARELSFANTINTPDGGMHSTGFRSALTRSINAYARSEGYLKEKDENLISEDTREGMTTIISLKLPEPQFEGQTKARLGTPDARTAVEAVANESLKEFFEKHPSDARSIMEKILLAAKARKAAKAAKDTVLRKGALEGLTLPGKLADCSSRNAEESELYIVEGDSAGGTAKSGRDRRTQAILPLKGKILNVEKARLDRMLANQEIRSLVVAIGTAIADEFDLEKLRYHKIVLMSDADVDGAHIRTLLLTFFFRYFRKVVDGGYLYIAQPPLYRIAMGKEVSYAYTDQQKETILAEFKKNKQVKEKAKAKAAGASEAESQEAGEASEQLTETGGIRGVSIQRYKGLGEMNAEQLWDTTMNPENRILLQVTVDDAERADHMFDMLMGEEVEARKQFIQTQALAVKNLDI